MSSGGTHRSSGARRSHRGSGGAHMFRGRHRRRHRGRPGRRGNTGGPHLKRVVGIKCGLRLALVDLGRITNSSVNSGGANDITHPDGNLKLDGHLEASRKVRCEFLEGLAIRSVPHSDGTISTMLGLDPVYQSLGTGGELTCGGHSEGQKGRIVGAGALTEVEVDCHHKPAVLLLLLDLPLDKSRARSSCETGEVAFKGQLTVRSVPD